MTKVLATTLPLKKQIELVKQFVAQAQTDPVIYIDRFLGTFDPRLPTPHLRFHLFDFQKDLVREIKAAIEGGYDLFIDKSRDMGATYATLGVFLWFWRYVVGSNFLIGSRKEALVDNRFGNLGQEAANKEESLFGKLQYMLEKCPSWMLPQTFSFQRHTGYMRLVNPETGSVISGESSNPNFSRGGRYKAILFDEFAFWENDIEAWSATADSTNCRIVLTTPGIRPSKAKRLRFNKDSEQIKLYELDWRLDPRKDKTWETKERARRSSEDFAREVQRNWETSVKGRVYEEIVKAKVGDFPYNPDYPLYIAWDFGLDGTVLQWWQKNLANGKPRLVEAYENRDKPIQFYFPFVGAPIDSTFELSTTDLKVIHSVSHYKKAIHFGDPDVAKRAYQEVSTISTRANLEKIGVYVQTKPEANDFLTRRDRLKVLLQEGIEVSQTPGTDYWLECLSSARYPERSESSQATTEIVKPIHDWTSHHRSASEYLSVNWEFVSLKTLKPTQAWDESFGKIYR